MSSADTPKPESDALLADVLESLLDRSASGEEIDIDHFSRTKCRSTTLKVVRRTRA